MKSTITKKYAVDYVIDFADNYVFTKCKRCFNKKTNREIKQQYKKYLIKPLNKQTPF